MKIHTTSHGENAYTVASEYGISPIRLAWCNELCDMSRLAVGRELLVLMPTRTCTARNGDTTDSVARRFGISEGELMSNNPDIRRTGKLIAGRELVIKRELPTLGYGIGNGYLYMGCTDERLRLALPYISYLTICAYEYSGGRIKKLFNDEKAIDEGRKNKKILLMRVYSEECGEGDTLMTEAIKAAKDGGFDGITLSSFSTLGEGEMLEARKRCLGEGLMLFGEARADVRGRASEYADGMVLTADKLHMRLVPSFAEFELKNIKEYADECECGGAFLELSSFARLGDAYIDKTRALALADKGKIRLTADEDALVLRGEIGRGRLKRELVTESLKSTKAKLELVSELGLRGVCFDIMRIPLSELMMFGAVFSRPPSVGGRRICNPAP